MFAYFESSSISTNDSTIQCLSWMGKVSNETNNKDKDWKCDRFLYYQDGWLATGGTNGIVGSTYTSTITSERLVVPPRTNFNLRGHKNEIKLVKWNEPYQKLASCDSKGVIYVWVKYEGRWSIELINDRGKIVSDFEWSHDGRMAAICYEDGFVLVGSVNGQRFWSHLFDLNSSSICSITWSPDDFLVLLGLSSGTIMVVDKNGTYLTRVSVSDQPISQLTFNSHKFFMDEETTTNIKLQSNRKNINNNDYLLACCFQNSDQVNILRTYDDIDPIIIKTGFNYNNNSPIKFEWSNCGNILAVGGCERLDLIMMMKSSIKFYNKYGVYMFKLEIPIVDEMFKAFCWGHNDERLFITTNKNIYISIVKKSIASCCLLAQLRVRSCIKDTKIIEDLNLPIKLKYDLKQTYKTAIRNNYPKSIEELRVFVCSKQNERLHCTMKRNIDDDNNNDFYTLYLEYLGNLIPLLKAKKCSKIKPNFVIFDPNYTITTSQEELKRSLETTENELLAKSSSGYSSDTDDSDVMFYDSLCSSPKSKSKSLNLKKKKRKSIKENNINAANDEHKLIEINSNLWGTKFKFNGLNYLPFNIGSITYKTSLFHLQPRQMKIKIKDLSLYSSLLKEKRKLINYNYTPKMSYRRKFLSFSKPKILNKRSKIDFKSISDEDCDDDDDENENGNKLNMTEISSFGNQYKNYVTSSSNSEVEEKRNEQTTTTGSNLIIYPLNDQKKQNSSFKKHQNLSSNNNVSTLSASNDLTKLQYISRPTSPANLIRPISPPAIQIKEPISSPRINTRHLLTQQQTTATIKKSTDDIRSVVSCATIINTDSNFCDNDEVITYLKPTQANSANSSSYSAINQLNEFEKFKSLISCLDPTTNDISNRVLLLNNDKNNNNNEDKLSFSDPILSAKTAKLDSISLSPASSSHTSSSKSLKTSITSTTIKNNSTSLKNEKLKPNIKVYSNDFNKARKSVSSKTSLRDKQRKQRSKSENFENKQLAEENRINDIEYVMHNKPPIWNQANQVYQLDFGGRVTQESAKNFQIEYNGKQIMQFGRIDGNAYTLDFEWPFTVVQAFSIALANITQRLK